MSDKRSISSNFMWRFLESFGAQGVTFIVSIVLARKLGPEPYGTVAIVMVFTAIVSVFVNFGMNAALIQKKDADDLDFSTAFYFLLFMSTVMYLIMFFAAPGIDSLYRNGSAVFSFLVGGAEETAAEKPDLIGPIRGLSLILFTSGIKHIQSAYVSRHMIFKRFFFATLGGTLVAAGVGIWMAIAGYGVWALIVQNLVNTTIDTLILWITVPWRPKRMFSFTRLKGLLTFGWKILASSLIDTVYNKLYQLVIGMAYTNADLAYYNKGDTLPGLVVNNLNVATDSVLLPVMAQEQDDRLRVRETTRRVIQISSFVIMPMMAGLAACAKPGVRLLLKDTWLPCVPFLQIFCFVYAFQFVHTANLNAIKALGRSDLYLKLEIIKKLVGLTTLIVTVRYGVLAMALGSIFNCIVSQLINSWPNRRLLDYAYLDQLKDMLPQLLLSLAMGGIVLSVQLLGLNDLLTLLIQIPLGVALYVGGAKLLKLEAFDYCLTSIREMMAARKKA